MRRLPQALPAEVAGAALLAASLAASPALAPPAQAAEAAEAERGAYLAAVAGCLSCHTDEKRGTPPYAGGAPIRSPFGSFVPPNITPDPEHGIGGWTAGEFVRALREGVSPDGDPYYPAFPYMSYAGMTEEDALDIHAFLMTVDPVPEPAPGHDVGFPFSVREGLWAWRLLYFDPPRDRPPPAGRGDYLANALAHCGECHTPRNAIGAPDLGMAFAGAALGDGDTAPNITPDPDTGIGKWSEGDLRFFLSTGLTPSGDAAGGAMALVIEHSTGKLTGEDSAALLEYLRGVPAIRNEMEADHDDHDHDGLEGEDPEEDDYDYDY